MGSIYKRGKKGTLWIKWNVAGRSYYQSTGSTKLADAEKLLRQKLTAKDLGLPVAPRVDKYTFEQAYDDLINWRKSNGYDDDKNVKLKGRIDKNLTPFFTKRKMSTITPLDVRAYVARRLGQGAKNATINRELTILKKMFSLACDAGILIARPKIQLLKESNVRTGFFEPDQYEAVIKHLDPVLADVVTFAYLTGWRISEVLGLEWKQVDLHVGQVRLEPGTTKNKEGRTFPLVEGKALRQLIDRRAIERDACKKRGIIVPEVFFRMVARGRRGKKYPKPITTFSKSWKNACAMAGCPGRIVHDLRRTAVRNFERAGVPRSVAMSLTGHKTEAVYRRYDIVSQADLRVAVERLHGEGVTFGPKTVTR